MNSSYPLVMTSKKRFPWQKNYPRLFQVTKFRNIYHISYYTGGSEWYNPVNSSKSAGPNIIPTKIIKAIKDQISIPLSKLFNKSFNIGIFPNICKLARVVPVFKSEIRQLCNNYRPNSLLQISVKWKKN